MSVRLQNILGRLRIKTLEDLASMTIIEFRRELGVGALTLAEAQSWLAKAGLVFKGQPDRADNPDREGLAFKLLLALVQRPAFDINDSAFWHDITREAINGARAFLSATATHQEESYYESLSKRGASSPPEAEPK